MTETKQAFVTGSKRLRRQGYRDSKVEAGRGGGKGSTAKGSRRVEDGKLLPGGICTHSEEKPPNPFRNV